jgi:hypothetical protein
MENQRRDGEVVESSGMALVERGDEAGSRHRRRPEASAPRASVPVIDSRFWSETEPRTENREQGTGEGSTALKLGVTP